MTISGFPGYIIGNDTAIGAGGPDCCPVVPHCDLDVAITTPALYTPTPTGTCNAAPYAVDFCSIFTPGTVACAADGVLTGGLGRTCHAASAVINQPHTDARCTSYPVRGWWEAWYLAGTRQCRKNAQTTVEVKLTIVYYVPTWDQYFNETAQWVGQFDGEAVTGATADLPWTAGMYHPGGTAGGGINCWLVSDGAISIEIL